MGYRSCGVRCLAGAKYGDCRITAGNGGKCKNRVCVAGQEGFAAATTR